MSWKSIVITGLLCVAAAPAWAVPSLSITNTGLDATGNWTWNVLVTPTGGSSLAVELGLRESFAGSQFVSATIGPAPWDTPNPGTKIFTWEAMDVDGDFVGLQSNAALDEIFLAYGSAIQAAATQTQLLTIKTKGPTTTQLTTSLQLLGKYGAGGTNGRIAEGLGTPPGTNYSNFSGTATRSVVPGNANFTNDGVGGAAVGLADLQIVASNLNKFPGVAKFWNNGDFNGAADGVGGAEVGLADLQVVASCLNRNTAACSGAVNTPLNVVGVAGGAGSVGGASVPEPTSAGLAFLGLVGLCSLVRRKK